MLLQMITTEYFHDTDTLGLSLDPVAVANKEIFESDEVTANLLVDYSADHKILNLDISYASQLLPAIRHEIPCQRIRTSLVIMLAEFTDQSKILRTDDSRIDIMYRDGKWTAIVIHD